MRNGFSGIVGSAFSRGGTQDIRFMAGRIRDSKGAESGFETIQR